MASEAQIAANRRNAERSTGPRTAEGKARAAQNGLKHGLCAAATVLPWEDRAEFEAMVADLTQRLQPADEVELALLLQYADATWRRQRCGTLETGLLAGAMPETTEGCPEGVHPTAWAMGQAWMARSKEINRLSLHESRLARLAERALDRLAAAQARRRQVEAEAELALDSQADPLPPLRERMDGAERRPGESPPSGADPKGQRSARSGPPSSAQRPDPRPNPLPQERERKQDQELAPELASFLRNAA
jgi:hypothetical protein